MSESSLERNNFEFVFKKSLTAVDQFLQLMKGRITVIDDDNDLRNLLQIALRLDGFSVNAFSSGDEFLIAYHAGIIADLYVIDINLGGITGAELCEKIKTSNKQLKSIVILISANPEVQQLAKQVSADDYMLKPFSQRELLLKIVQLMENRKLTA